MPTLSELEALNTAELEQAVSQGIVQRMIAGLQSKLTDWSPSAPQVVIGEAVAWGTSLLLYYTLRIPEAVEEWVVRRLFGGSEKPAQAARAYLLLTFSEAAPVGGHTLRAGTAFRGGDVNWVLENNYTYPPGAFGSEQVAGEYLYLVPVRAQTAGKAGNVIAGIINQSVSTIPGLVSVTNPAPAGEGADLESYESMRDRIFATPLDGNLVEPQDFERFVRGYLGGGQVYTITPPPTPGSTHLSVVYPDGSPLVSDTALKNAIEAKDPRGPVVFVAPNEVAINVTADLYFDPALTDAATIVADSINLLAQYARPQTWKLWGQSPNGVWRSSLTAELQKATGIKRVVLRNPSSDVVFPTPNSVPTLGIVSLTPYPDPEEL